MPPGPDPSFKSTGARRKRQIKPLLQRTMVVLVMVAFSFQGASGAMQRLLMPAHYHAGPTLPDAAAPVMRAKPDPHALIHEEVIGGRFTHAWPSPFEDDDEHDEDRFCDHDCERPSGPDHGTHRHAPALATGHADHDEGDDASHVAGHAHAVVRAHRHDHGGTDVVLVAEEVDTPAAALRQNGLEGLWSLLPERMVLAVATAQGSLPAFVPVTHRVLANSAPKRPPRL